MHTEKDFQVIHLFLVTAHLLEYISLFLFLRTWCWKICSLSNYQQTSAVH